MRKKKLPPDTRPKWYNEVVDKPYLQLCCEYSLEFSKVPRWYDDPSYSWKETTRKGVNG